MYNWLLNFLIFLLNLKSFSNVSEQNRLYKEAEEAYYAKNYTKAIQNYEQIKRTSFIFKPEARLNLAHAYFNTKDSTNALKEYRYLLKTNNDKITASTLVQIGILNTSLGDSTSGVNLFKQAVKNNPDNRIASFNFELLTKRLPPKKQNQQNQEQKTETQSEQEASPEQTDKKEDELNTLKNQRMSKDKALQILEAMKTNELHYLNNRKTSSNGKNYNDY